MQVRSLVDQYGADLATSTREVMVAVAKCESGLRQVNDDGSVVESHTGDFGLFQINSKYHLEASKNMGLDIMTASGNTRYAIYLVKRNGFRDWSASENCWRD